MMYLIGHSLMPVEWDSDLPNTHRHCKLIESVLQRAEGTEPMQNGPRPQKEQRNGGCAPQG